VAAIGVGVGLISMITLLPALLVVCGRWVFWPIKPRYGSPEPTRSGVWARVGKAIAPRPRAVWVVTAVLLAVFWLGLIGFKFGPLTTAQSFRGTPSSITAQNVLDKYYPAGTGEPVDVIANAASAGAVRNALAATPGIASVTQPVTKGGLAWMEATMTVPPDSSAAYTLVDHIRTTVHAIPGADAKVGGGTAINADVESAAAHDRDLLIPLILGVVFLILGLLLRAIVAPLVLIATVVLSFGTALGLSALFFKHVFGFAGADTSVPLFVFVFLVALGIDYNIFLMTRIGPVRYPPRGTDRPSRHRRRDHLGGPGAGRDVRGTRHAAAGRVHRDRVRGRDRRADRHDHRQVGARHGADLGHRPAHVVAERAGAPAVPARGADPPEPPGRNVGDGGHLECGFVAGDQVTRMAAWRC